MDGRAGVAAARDAAAGDCAGGRARGQRSLGRRRAVAARAGAGHERLRPLRGGRARPGLRAGPLRRLRLHECGDWADAGSRAPRVDGGDARLLRGEQRQRTRHARRGAGRAGAHRRLCRPPARQRRAPAGGAESAVRRARQPGGHPRRPRVLPVRAAPARAGRRPRRSRRAVQAGGGRPGIRAHRGGAGPHRGVARARQANVRVRDVPVDARVLPGGGVRHDRHSPGRDPGRHGRRAERHLLQGRDGPPGCPPGAGAGRRLQGRDGAVRDDGAVGTRARQQEPAAGRRVRAGDRRDRRRPHARRPPHGRGRRTRRSSIAACSFRARLRWRVWSTRRSRRATSRRRLGRTLGRPNIALRDPDTSPEAPVAWPGRRVAVLFVDGTIVDGPSAELPFGMGGFAGVGHAGRGAGALPARAHDRRGGPAREQPRGLRVRVRRGRARDPARARRR